MMGPEVQAEWMKVAVANAMGHVMGAVRAIGWDEEDFFDKWLVDRDAASQELCERIDEYFEEAAVEQWLAQLRRLDEGDGS